MIPPPPQPDPAYGPPNPYQGPVDQGPVYYPDQSSGAGGNPGSWVSYGPSGPAPYQQAGPTAYSATATGAHLGMQPPKKGRSGVLLLGVVAVTAVVMGAVIFTVASNTTGTPAADTTQPATAGDQGNPRQPADDATQTADDDAQTADDETATAGDELDIGDWATRPDKYSWEGDQLSLGGGYSGAVFTPGKRIPSVVVIEGGPSSLDFTGYTFTTDTEILVRGALGASGNTSVYVPPSQNVRIVWSDTFTGILTLQNGLDAGQPAGIVRGAGERTVIRAEGQPLLTIRIEDLSGNFVMGTVAP